MSLTARTLYAELLGLAQALGATESIGPQPGTVVRKTLKGGEYLYYQYRDLDGRTRQAYLGPNDDNTLSLIEALDRRGRDRQADLQRLAELRAAFVAAGGTAMEHAPLRVLQGFADAGVLQPGPGCAALIGTQGFNALGNLLGVRWASVMSTQDIDVAADIGIDLALTRPAMPAPDVLSQLEMGFIPVPTLDPRSHSTSYRVRGQEMRVDLLTPLQGKPKAGGVFVPALNAMAQPLRYLDYLLVELVPVVVVGRKTQALINVPSPERFALHKLLVSQSRSAVFATKAAKDRAQAYQLLEVLMHEAPDGVPAALCDLLERGEGWHKKLSRALDQTPRSYDPVAQWLMREIDDLRH